MPGLIVARKYKPPSRAARITAQVQDVRNMLARGYQSWRIVRHLQDVHGISERTAERRLQDARSRELDEFASIDRTELAAQMLDAYQEILQASQTSKAYNASIGAINGILRLTGLVDPNQK